jgi:hypothetical protein
MPELLLLLLASYGLWFAIARSDLPVIGRLRDILCERSTLAAKFFMCAACSGFWASLAVAALMSIGKDFGVREAVWVLLSGFAGSASTYLIETHVTKMEER